MKRLLCAQNAKEDYIVLKEKLIGVTLFAQQTTGLFFHYAKNVANHQPTTIQPFFNIVALIVMKKLRGNRNETSTNTIPYVLYCKKNLFYVLGDSHNHYRFFVVVLEGS
jgi:hypothetical protein